MAVPDSGTGLDAVFAIFAMIPAIAAVAVSRLVIGRIRWARIERILGARMSESNTTIDPRLAVRAARIGRAVNRAARLIPFAGDCLTRAVAAKLLLRLARAPATLYVGATLDPAHAPGDRPDVDFGAHAWVRVGADVVTGAAQAAAHEPLLWYT